MSTVVKIGIIGGSGLDNPDILKNKREKEVSTPFGSPSDVLILGEINGVECVLLARHGRKHDIMPSNVNYRANIWALKQEGCTHVIVSNACGSLREEIKPGEIVILDDFIDRTFSRAHTFYDGELNHPIGVCHLPIHPPFCERTRQNIIKVAEDLGIPVHKKGTIIVIEGPRFSTKAESFMHRQWGGDVIGMTTSPEATLAKEAGLCYASIALATDYDVWRETGENVTHTSVLQVFLENVKKVTNLLTSVIPVISNDNWDHTIKQLRDEVNGSVILPH